MTRVMTLAIFSLAPFLMAPYFRSCGEPVHGVFPMPCHPGSANCPGVDTARMDNAEQRLVDAQTTSVLILNRWAELEPCFQYPLFGFDDYRTDHDGCWIADDLEEPTQLSFYNRCSCYWNLDVDRGSAKSIVAAWLKAFVAQHPPCTGGRSVLIQLGTMFGPDKHPRSVPAYLKKVRYDDPRMIRAFARYWDKISEVLARPEFRKAEFVISIGNELDLYLDDSFNQKFRFTDDDGNLVDGVPTEAWRRYATFYKKAAAYVKGKPVVLDDGTTLPNTSSKGFTRTVGFTMTWGECSPFPSGDCGTQWQDWNERDNRNDAYLSMIKASDHWIYTRYRPFTGYGSNVRNVYREAYDTLYDTFLDMAAYSALSKQLGAGRANRPILIQEIGFPSSRVHYIDNAIEDQQKEFVRAAFDAWRSHNERWISLGEWWRRLGEGQIYNPADAPFSRPRILGLNWFMLHDFSNTAQALPNCPFEDQNPTQTCSWGLIDETGREKPAWQQFVASSRAVNSGRDYCR